jgi:monomeric isocitrate dehydrogenase
MSTSINIDNDLKDILAGLKKLNSQEQRTILAQINATLMLKKGIPIIAKTKGQKPMTMLQIDSIKHKSRKEQHAK